jgi:hypothetical protein
VAGKTAISPGDFMTRIPRSFIFAGIVILLLILVWQKLRIILFVPLSLGQAVLLFGGAALVLFLVVDHFINRSKK